MCILKLRNLRSNAYSHGMSSERGDENPQPSDEPKNVIANFNFDVLASSISGLVVEYTVAIDVTRVRFPSDAF